MSNDEIHVRLSFSRRQLKGLMVLALLSGLAYALYSENVTLSTYYPAPSGVYSQMITTSNTYLARDAGRVGIGTTNPGFKLHVFPEAGGQVAINGKTNAASNLAYMLFNWNDGTNMGWVGDGSGGDDDIGLAASRPSGSIRFYSGGSYAAPKMHIASSGNVGIGTTNPQRTLDVAGDIRATQDVCTNLAGGRCLSSVQGQQQGGLYGYCMETWDSANNDMRCGLGGRPTLTPAVCDGNRKCACPGGYTLIRMGEDEAGSSSGWYHSDSCYKN